MKQVQELMKLQQQAQKVQAELDNIHIEAESQGFVITLNGQLKAIKVEIEDATLLQDQAKLEAAALEAINKGMKKAQEIAAQKMQEVMGDLGLKLPGM